MVAWWAAQGVLDDLSGGRGVNVVHKAIYRRADVAFVKPQTLGADGPVPSGAPSRFGHPIWSRATAGLGT
jgi:hypothetical protein